MWNIVEKSANVELEGGEEREIEIKTVYLDTLGNDMLSQRRNLDLMIINELERNSDLSKLIKNHCIDIYIYYGAFYVL